MAQSVDRYQDQVRALAERYKLAHEAAIKLARLLELLVSNPRAPTAIRDPARAVEDHLADSLVALELDQVRTATEAADLGAGAGLPGLALAIALPGLHVALIESSRRKCDFIERAADVCEVANASVVCERAETWSAGLGRMDLVTARALAPLPVVLEYAAPLLRVGGALVMWRGKRDSAAESAGPPAAERLGLQELELRRVRPYEQARDRHLHVMLKERDTPPGFPRRPGAALKHPLAS
ncbi:MAG: 16S rRNA (guanine(527)-N(7))-methyltransferase RsmG [Actinomycetota bacterium]|nr:16S rRNA (guanine(527)-N(7))-methyltransferase RsmG [Actinomycetota bacterium]